MKYEFINGIKKNEYNGGVCAHIRTEDCKHYYADLAYKYRMQAGDFYAFDDTYLSKRLDPVNVDLDTHQVFFSIGYKF